MIFLSDERVGVILKVTIEKINLGAAYLRRYHVVYSSGVVRCYNVPPDTVLKFIKENKCEMSKVAFIFTDGSEVE